ncbi:hypothetical protein ACFYKX_11580 [Cytobacillus sp. FJAT-54145]|uniref:Uncharacterized protein n=1 Tax=Cytobacillus spartinae TaxID=3299023 RepID=A0ABW6KEW0_9BACI
MNKGRVLEMLQAYGEQQEFLCGQYIEFLPSSPSIRYCATGYVLSLGGMNPQEIESLDRHALSIEAIRLSNHLVSQKVTQTIESLGLTLEEIQELQLINDGCLGYEEQHAVMDWISAKQQETLSLVG